MKFKTVEQEITPILKSSANTRRDDMLLYSCYVYSKGAELTQAFASMDYRHLYDLAPYETVSRVRRKLQEKYAELRPTAEQIEEKKRAEKEYKLYAKGVKK